MATFFADIIFKCIFLTDTLNILILILLKFISKGPFDYELWLVLVSACHLFRVKPLFEPMMTQFTDDHMYR